MPDMNKKGYKGLIGKGLIGYEGLDTLIRAGLPRPVQIMRQTISNLDIPISPLLAYHNYKGLSSPPKAGGIEKIP
jgi:hypothetical protein